MIEQKPKTGKHGDKMITSLTGEKMIDTLAQTNTGAGDKKDPRHHKDKNEPKNFPETDETGEFDFASLAFTPLTPSKLTDQQKPQEHAKCEESNRKTPHGSEEPERNHRIAYGYVIKQRRHENGQPHTLSPNGLNQSQQSTTKAQTKTLSSKSVTNPVTSSPTRSAPSLDMLRANLAKSTPMTAPKIDRRPLEQQTPEEHPEITTSNKDRCFIKRVPMASKSLTSPSTLHVPRVIPQHPRIHIIQRQSGIPAKPMSTGHRLPQLIYEPRSGKQIAQPAHRATKNALQTIRPGLSNSQHHQRPMDNRESQVKPVYTRVYHIPYNYSHQYLPSSLNTMTSNHSLKSKDSPVARYDQPPSSYPQVSNVSYSTSLDQHTQRPMTTPYRIPANQTNRIKQQMFSSLPAYDRRSKTDGGNTLSSRIRQQSHTAAQNVNTLDRQRRATVTSGSIVHTHSHNPSLAPQHSSTQDFNNSDRRTHAALSSGSMHSSNPSPTHRHSSRNLPPIYSRYTHTSDQSHFRPSRSIMTQQVAVPPNIRKEKDNSACHAESRYSNMHRLQVPPGPQLNFNNDSRFTDKSRCSCAEKRSVFERTRPGDHIINSSSLHLKTPSRRMPLLLPQNSSLRAVAPRTSYQAQKLPSGIEFPNDTQTSTTQVEHSTPRSHSTTCRQYRPPSKYTLAVDHHMTEKTAATCLQDVTDKSSKIMVHSKETNDADIQSKIQRSVKCKHGKYIQIEPCNETNNAPTDNLTANVEETNSTDKGNKVRKLIVQCPSTVDSRRDKEDVDDGDEDDTESRHKGPQVAPLFKKALKMLQNQRRILAKPGRVVSGPVPPGELTSEVPLKPTPKAKSRENSAVKDTGTGNDKGKTKSRKKFKIKRNVHDGKKRFATMSRKNQNRSGAESGHCETNKSGKCLKEKNAEGTSRLVDDWLVDDDENNDDITWFSDFKKSAHICNQRRAARAKTIHVSSAGTLDQDKQVKLSTSEHPKGSANHKGSKLTKKKASKRRKITKSRTKVSPRSKNDNDVTEEKKNTGSGRRMTRTSMSAMVWAECREVTMEQWRHCAEEKGLPRKEIDGIVACNKPEIAIEKQNGPPEFQELLVKRWQGVMVMSEQKIEAINTSNSTQDVKCDPSEEKFCESKTPCDVHEDEYVDVVGIVNKNDEHDAKSAFQIFVKNVIDNAERECDLPTSKDHPSENQVSTCQDWNTWERQVNGNKLLHDCRVKEDMKSNSAQGIDTERADNEVAAITATMSARPQNELEEQTEQNAQEIHEEIKQLQLPFTDFYDSNNFVGDQPIGYRTRWNVDEDADGYFVNNNEVIYVDDQSWIGEITEVVETCNNETEVIKVCEKAIECASKT